MGERDDGLGLSLSLSLKFPDNQNLDSPSLPPPPPPPPAPPAAAPFPLNCFRFPLHFMQHQQKSLSTDAFQSSSDRNAEPRSLFRGFDVNRSVTIVDGDEEGIVSSPNSTVSSLSGKRGHDNIEDNEGERASSSFEMDEDGGDAAARKKLRLSKEQGTVLEGAFKEHNTLNPKQKVALAKHLNLRPRQVEVWFQNRRARTKLKQTEVDCECLRRCCENLTEENKRLHKEVSELRALKMSPQFYMNTSPPTTLTMCPQCERVGTPSSTTNGSTSNSGLSRHAPHQPRPMTMASWASIIPPQPTQSPRP